MGRKLIDETGHVYGKLKVLQPIREDEDRKTMWLCECICGKKIKCSGSDLRKNRRTSCGSCNKIVYEQPGTIYNFLKIIEIDKTPPKDFPDKNTHWICECQLCGTVKSISGRNLRNGTTKSCGCMESIGERYIAQILQELNLKYEKEYTFSDLKSEKGSKYRFDFAIFDEYNNLLFLIEYNGTQHFYETNFTKTSLMDIQESDLIKELYCIDNQINKLNFNYKHKGKTNILYDELKNEIVNFYLYTINNTKKCKITDYDF